MMLNHVHGVANLKCEHEDCQTARDVCNACVQMRRKRAA